MATMVATPDLSGKILQLRKDIETTTTLRARTEAALNLVQRQAAEADEQLKALGVSPETAEQELATLREGIEQSLTKLAEDVKEETAEYQRILQKVKAAGLA